MAPHSGDLAGVMHDLGDTAEELVVAGIQEPEVKLEQVKRWPASIVLEIAKAVSEFNGFPRETTHPERLIQHQVAEHLVCRSGSWVDR